MNIKGDILKRRELMRDINIIIERHDISENRLKTLLNAEIGAVQGIRHRQTPAFSEKELEYYLDKLQRRFNLKL